MRFGCGRRDTLTWTLIRFGASGRVHHDLSCLPHEMPIHKLKVGSRASKQPDAPSSSQHHRPAPPAAAAAAPSPPVPVRPFFPYARYISLVGVHTSLLAFTALILPRSAFADLSSPTAARLKPRRDPMLVISESPARSLAWMCLGSFVLQLWWGGWLRDWRLEASVAPVPQAADGTLLETEAQKAERRIRQKEWDSQKANVGSRRDSGSQDTG